MFRIHQFTKRVNFKILILKDDDDFDTSQYSEYYNGFDEFDEALSRGVGFVDGKGNKIGHWKWYYPNGGLWRTGEHQNDKAQAQMGNLLPEWKIKQGLVIMRMMWPLEIGSFISNGQVLAYGSYQWSGGGAGIIIKW